MLGIVPAAGIGSRMQPLGCSKELLPLGWPDPAAGPSRAGFSPRAVAEYVLERMLLAGADRIALVVAGEKTDLLRYFARSPLAPRLFFLLQGEAAGLCDALFRAVPHVRPVEPVLIGLPDTVWFPADAYARAPARGVHLITFPVERPERFDAVVSDGAGRVLAVEVKRPGAADRRVWGALRMPGADFLELHRLWRERSCRDGYLGDLLNAYLAAGGAVTCDRAGVRYHDIGTPEAYADALARRVWLEQPAVALEVAERADV